MNNCSRCSVSDVCDECDEGFYWFGSVCEAYVVCDSTHFSYWTEEGK
jgi:hypothetical protein